MQSFCNSIIIGVHFIGFSPVLILACQVTDVQINIDFYYLDCTELEFILSVFNLKQTFMMISTDTRKKQNFTPAKTLALSFLVLIIIGTVLLYMPFSSEKKVSVIDALFPIKSIKTKSLICNVDALNLFRSKRALNSLS